MARISCHSQLILNTRRQYAATNWRFSRQRPLSGCMERKTCHGLPPENAPRRNLATARPPGTHRARILPLPVRPRAHQGAILPPSDAGGRTAREYCHYQSPENAFRAYPAIAGCLGMHSVDILPSADIRECAVSAYLHCRSSGRATFSTRGSGFRPLAALWGFGAQHFLCEGVGIPPSRGLTAGNDFESALFRWATMSSLRVLRSCAVLCAEAKSALTFI